jgi:hypothetical protein
MKNTKRPHGLLNYTKYYVKIPKYSQKQSFFFFLSFLRLKVLFYYTWKLKKPVIPSSNSPSFFDLGGKEVFLLLQIS